LCVKQKSIDVLYKKDEKTSICIFNFGIALQYCAGLWGDFGPVAQNILLKTKKAGSPAFLSEII